MTDNGGSIGNGQQHTVWVRAFNASGWQASFTFVLPDDNPIECATALIASLAANGYTPNAPGLEAGDIVEEIGLVARRQKVDGTPIIDLYSPNAKVVRKVFSHYLELDQPLMAAEFKRVTGIDYTALPLWEGEQAISKEAGSAGKYIIPLKAPCKIVLKKNPVYDANDEKKKYKPEHLFVRWQDAPTPPAPQLVPKSDPPALDGMPPSMNAGHPVPDVLKPLVQTEAQKEAYQVVMKNRTLRDKLSIKNAADFDNAIAALKLDDKPVESTDDILGGLYERAGMQYQKVG